MATEKQYCFYTIIMVKEHERSKIINQTKNVSMGFFTVSPLPFLYLSDGTVVFRGLTAISVDL